MRRFLNYIAEFFGGHVCWEFTRWQRKKQNYSRPARPEEALMCNLQTVEFTQCWQERECTLCGKVFQAKLPHGVSEEE
jgi:hypothetical protein